MARTTVVDRSTHPVSCEIVTPARILMSSFPLKASTIPGSFSIECAICGLQLMKHNQKIFTNLSRREAYQRMTTSASRTAFKFSPATTSTCFPKPAKVALSLSAVSRRLTQAINRSGILGSDSEYTGVDVPGVCDSHFNFGDRMTVVLDSMLVITPDRIAMPMVPHPETTQMRAS